MKKHLISMSILTVLFASSSLIADTRTFIKEYSYQAGEADSKISARTIALEQVKRLLLEELGTYLESETEVRNFQLTRDQITTLTAGIVQTQILKERWDGERYWLQARIEADPEEVARSVDSLRRSKGASKNLEDADNKVKDALREIAQLKKELESKQKDKSKLKRYDEVVKELGAIDWYRKGVSSLHKRSLQEAISDFTKAIELNPRDASSYVNRSFAHGASGNDRKALEDASRAVELDPASSMAYVNRGVAHFKLYRDYHRYISDTTKAIELDPNNFMAYKNRARAYLDLRDSSRAINDIKAAARLNDEESRDYLRSRRIRW
jgi:tetratricopeptide (TPR) repeat protein